MFSFKKILIFLTVVTFKSYLAQYVAEGTVFVTNESNITSDGNSTKCIDITECKIYLWLLKINRTESVLQDFVDRVCGLEGVSPMVECPVEENLTTRMIKGRNRLKQNGKPPHLKSHDVDVCMGSLIILHYGEDGSRFQRSVVEDNHINQLETMEKLFVIKLHVVGGCCWVIFDGINFKGQQQHLPPGFNEPPSFQPKSIKMIKC